MYFLEEEVVAILLGLKWIPKDYYEVEL